jgi:hypothetical protein
MRRFSYAGLLMSFAFCMLRPNVAMANDDSIGLEDLPNYHAALIEDSREGSPVAVTFSDLWDRPDSYRDLTVSVVGRIARRFHQPPVGRFPALTETWLVDTRGNPTCFVAPTTSQRHEDLEVGAWVRVSGRYLKRIRYRGHDSDRLAPLIVGPHAPAIMNQATPFEWNFPSRGSLDWAVGITATAGVTVILLGLHLRRPRPRRPLLGPTPTFVSDLDDGDDDVSGTDPMGSPERSEHETPA